MKIDASELKREGKEVIQNLTEYIKNKIAVNVTVESRIINVVIENEELSKKYIRVLIKKFLHKSELKEYYRVLSGSEDTFRIKEKKVYEE